MSEGYTIRKGESLSVIAKRNNTTVANLKEINGIKDVDSIWVGQKLRLKREPENGKSKSIFHKALIKAIDEQKIPSFDEMIVNNMPLKEDLKKVANSKSLATAKKSETSSQYTIKKGDTLYKIAQENGLSIEELKKANPGINERTLKIGAKLNLPVKETEQSVNPFGIENEKMHRILIGPFDKWREIKERNALSIAEKHAKRAEKFSSKVYRCPTGHLTYGYGHRVDKDNGQTITEAQATELLKKDLQKAFDGIKKALGEEAYNKLNSKQLAALTNIAFNAGIDGTVNTQFFALIKQGKFDEAQAKMDAVYGKKIDKKGRVVKGTDGKPVKVIQMGLLIRRAKEMLMFGEGKLSPAAEKRVLELLNEGLKTKFTTLGEAQTELWERLAELEQANAKNRAKMTPAEKSRLRQLRNVRELLDVLKSPQEYAMSLDKDLPAVANR